MIQEDSMQKEKMVTTVSLQIEKKNDIDRLFVKRNNYTNRL